ncbi:hypothetical protein RhiirA4_544152 [Rhizophagus irregularis]|uniref:Ion transport domain-containing protein n=1 Tax=Rhizophagus irregularis TaxID=588596 RepID=A0A2I1GM74_9GLOM|nr:hypothetical protein RhiirA4_544152 [Rhizophagus irregularis]
MSEIIEINNDADKIEVADVDKNDVDKNNVDKIFTFDDIDDEPHNGKPITMINISPKEKYLITYSNEDCSIIGWNVKDINKVQLEFHKIVKINENNEDNEDNEYEIESLCVSDDKKLAYITRITNHDNKYTVIDINNKNKKITLSFDKKVSAEYCTFNLEGEFILYSVVDTNKKRKIIWIYSTQTKNNKWDCKRFYRILEDYELISISKYDRVYLSSNDCIYEWNINTERGVKIFYNNVDKNKIETKYIGIFTNEKFISLKINDKIIVYSIELGIPIASLDINDDIQLYNFMNHTGLFLLPSLFYYTQDKGIWNSIKYFWNNKYKNIFNQTLFDGSTDDQTKFVFGILNGRVWNSKFNDKMSKTNFSSENSDELNKENNKIVESIINDDNIIELAGNLIKWDVRVKNGKINLAVFNKHNTEWNLINMRIENFHYPYKKYNRISNNHKLIASSLFNNNDSVILTTFGILIYTFSESNKSISLNYFYFIKLDEYETGYMRKLRRYETIFSESIFPLPNYDSFRLDGWVSDVVNNKSSLLKYGGELLKFAIKEHKLELIDDIYKKTKNNKFIFLKYGVELLTFAIKGRELELIDDIYKKYEYYPEYILKYSSETNMIIDSSFYSIEHQNKNLHLYPFFQPPQIINLSQSLLWTKYYYKFYCTIRKNNSLLLVIIYVIQALIILLILPLYLATFYILTKFNFINNIYIMDVFSMVYFYAPFIFKIFKKNITPPTLTFMVPYINFVNYSENYNWIIELIRPPHSPFTEMLNRKIYKTWNGEALINFKWNAYGKYYYVMIWIFFTALLGCFTVAATISQQYINEEVRQQLFIASIILGFIHLIFEIRQFLYNITKWFYNFWNIFDIIAYVLSIYTSIYWLQTNDKNNNYLITLLSFSCLFLDIKFLLFFRALDYFGEYFAIIINVGKRIFSFLIVLFIIIISFAHSFYILLSPRSEFSLKQYNINSDDPNNPWKLAPSYNQIIDNNGNINSNPSMIQIPDKNTNMFTDIRTSLFAMYLFLTGDSSALSNWEYTDNPSIAILIVLFSLLVVVYLVNLLIGLLNMAIEKDNNKVSYLIQKAEILAEIELFYLLPHQKRWQTWFPEVIHYYADADKTRIEIERLIENGEWDTKVFTELRRTLLNGLQIKQNTIDDEFYNLITG